MSKLEALLLLCICSGAFIMPFISRWLRLPSAVGEIIFGLGVGIFFKEAFFKTSIIKFLGQLGFILLMYMAGLEIDFEKMKSIPRRSLLLYALMVGLVMGLSFTTVIYLGQPLIYALVYLTTAVGLLFPVLKETGLMRSDTGQTLLIIGSLGEVFSLVMLTLFILYYQSGFSLNSLLHLSQLLAFVLGAYLLYKLFRLLIWWYPELVQPFLTTNDPVESGTRANLVNMFVFVALAAFFQMELIVGAFLGGMAFGIIFKKREEVQQKISGFAYGFLIPIFFIEVGLRFDIKIFLDFYVIITALVIVFIIFAVRLIASLILFRSHLSLMEIAMVPVSTSFALTLLAAIATFGLESHILQQQQAAAILLAAVLSAIIFPFILRGMISYMNNKKTAPKQEFIR